MRPTVKKVSIELDRERHLVYNFAAFVAFEEKTDKNFFEVLAQTGSGRVLSAKDLAALIWCGLIDEDPELKFEDLTKMTYASDVAALVAAVVEAHSAAQPEKKSGPFVEEPPKKPPESTGSNSGPSPDTTSA